MADLLAADYLGAVVAGLGFPFLLLPLLGQIDGALAVGAVNALAGLVVLWLFARDAQPAGALAAWARWSACWRCWRRGGAGRALRGLGPPEPLRRPHRARRAHPVPGDRAHPVR